MGILSTVGTVVLSIAGGVLATEITTCAPTWARRIIRNAVRRLPEEDRVASQAEWLAHLDDVPGNVGKMAHAIRIWNLTLLISLKRVDWDRMVRRAMFVMMFASFPMSAGGTLIDYYRGFRGDYLIIDALPACAFLTVAAGVILVGIFAGLYQLLRSKVTIAISIEKGTRGEE